MPVAGSHPRRAPLLLLALAAVASTAPPTPSVATATPSTHHQHSACAAPPSFLRYSPSAWEASWAERADGMHASGGVCAAARADAARSAGWLEAVAACASASSNCPPPHTEPLLSHFEYTCATSEGGNATWREPIEPLVGLLRHPYAVAACTPPGVAGVDIENKDYMLLGHIGGFGGAGLAGSGLVANVNPDPASHRLLRRSASRRSRHAGRAYLLDAGANAFNTSLAWFLSAYAQGGIEFDQVYAWEAAVSVCRDWA